MKIEKSKEEQRLERRVVETALNIRGGMFLPLYETACSMGRSSKRKMDAFDQAVVALNVYRIFEKARERKRSGRGK